DGSLLEPEHEVRGREHRLERIANAFLESALRGATSVDAHQGFLVVRRERVTIGARAEAVDDLLGARPLFSLGGRTAGGDDFAALCFGKGTHHWSGAHR